VYPVAWWLNPAYRWEPIRMLLLRINQDDYFSYAYMHSHVYIHMFIILICPRVINKVSTCVGVTIWLFNIAMENGLFIDGLPIKNGNFLGFQISVYPSIQWILSFCPNYFLLRGAMYSNQDILRITSHVLLYVRDILRIFNLHRCPIK